MNNRLATVEEYVEALNPTWKEIIRRKIIYQIPTWEKMDCEITEEKRYDDSLIEKYFERDYPEEYELWRMKGK